VRREHSLCLVTASKRSKALRSFLSRQKLRQLHWLMQTGGFLSRQMRVQASLFSPAVACDCHPNRVKKRKRSPLLSKTFPLQLPVGHLVESLEQSRSNCPMTY
jgi:hypothetical protein